MLPPMVESAAGSASSATAFDVIGDVHGCFEELLLLLGRLSYRLREEEGRTLVEPPPGRHALFLGDLIDRGPRIPEVVELVMDMVAAGSASCLRGNHEHQLLCHLAGELPVGWGLAETLEQLAGHPPDLLERLRDFSAELPYSLKLDEGRLVVAHAGLPEGYQNLNTDHAHQFALYGTPVGTTPIEWVGGYKGSAKVVYGHLPVERPAWLNNTLCIDTGCVYGGRLTALRYPELELVAVEARREYYDGP
jgi:protein phosphatase